MSQEQQGPDQVAHELTDVARDLQQQDTQVDTWQRIVDLAVEQIDGCKAAGISLIRSNGHVETPVATDDIVREVDRIQYTTGQGPCLDAMRDRHAFRSGDLGQETRWPAFARAAADETGVRSMLSLRLFVRDTTYGALNLYSGHLDAFTEHDESIGALFAAHAALAMSSAEDRKHAVELEAALAHSREIGIALGMVMARQHVDRGAAFEILAGASQRTNTKLRVLAERLVTAHERRVTRG